MHRIETFHYKKTVAADIVSFKLEADLFKSVPMFLDFGCHGQHSVVSQWENGCCRNRSRWFHIRSRPLQISTDDPRLWQSWTTLRRFTIRTKKVVAETVGFRFEAHLFKSVPIILGSGWHRQNWDVSQRKRLQQRPQVSYSKHTYSNQHRCS